MIAGAGVGIDAEALAHHALALLPLALRSSGRMRRCLFSMHSDCATMTFGPCSLVVSASRSVSRILATS